LKEKTRSRLSIAPGLILTLASSVAIGDEIREFEVLSVLAPGNGSNETQSSAATTLVGSQVEMYDGLPRAVANGDEVEFRDYFKTATFDLAESEVASTQSPRPGLRILRDKSHGVPYVYADTRQAAMFGVGYVRAQDRLWQMESFRAVWRARSAEFLGAGEDNRNIKSDAQTFRLIDYSEQEYQRMFDRLRTAHGYWGRLAAQDIEAYVEGFNAYIDEINSDDSLLPIEYQQRQLTPQLWTVTDVIAMAAYSHVSWGSAGPGEEANAQLLRQLQQKLGDSGEDVFRDLRSAPGENTQHSLPPSTLAAMSTDANSIALIDLDSFVPRQISAAGNVAARVEPTIGVRRGGRSNALLVAAENSASGRPIAVQGPQDGYGTPHLFDSELVVVAPDFKARGILELSGPYPYVAARGEDYAWSITILPPDQADTFAEVLCEPDGSAATIDSDHYRYKGECRAFTHRVETREARDGTEYQLSSMRSVHGPVIGYATVDGAPVALSQGRSMYLHEEMDFPAHAKLFSPSVVQSAEDFINIVAGTAYNIGWWYVDDEDIAAVDAGLIPLRREGASTDLPVWGNGEWDWQGFDPESYTFRTPLKSQYPQAINGESGVIAGWNNPSAAGWPLKDEAFNFGGRDRVQLLREPTVEAAAREPLTIDALVRIHTLAAVTDIHAKQVYPLVRAFVGSVDDKLLEALLLRADAWVSAGSLRIDANSDGDLEHGPAMRLLDEFWSVLVSKAYEPLLGGDLLAGAGIENNLPVTTVSPDNASVWVSRIADGVSEYQSGDRTVFSRNYCGATKRACRELLLEAFRMAATSVRSNFGNDLNDWLVPTICDEGCLQIDFESTGDVPPVPPIGWQNRGTYIQVTTGK